MQIQFLIFIFINTLCVQLVTAESLNDALQKPKPYVSLFKGKLDKIPGIINIGIKIGIKCARDWNNCDHTLKVNSVRLFFPWQVATIQGLDELFDDAKQCRDSINGEIQLFEEEIKAIDLNKELKNTKLNQTENKRKLVFEILTDMKTKDDLLDKIKVFKLLLEKCEKLNKPAKSGTTTKIK